MEYVKTNREKSKTAKTGKFWCGGCDGNHVSQNNKCGVCGTRENRKKLFKF
jgi:hypothetical protein